MTNFEAQLYMIPKEVTVSLRYNWGSLSTSFEFVRADPTNIRSSPENIARTGGVKFFH
jgi:hypothetical protein